MVRLQTGLPNTLTEHFFDFPQSLQANAGIATSNRPRPYSYLPIISGHLPTCKEVGGVPRENLTYWVLV